MYKKDKLHSASPCAITYLLIHNSCNYFPKCTRIDVIIYTNAEFESHIQTTLIRQPNVITEGKYRSRLESMMYTSLQEDSL